MFASVLLPEPFGPMMRVHFALVHRQGDALEDLFIADVRTQIFDLEQRVCCSWHSLAWFDEMERLRPLVGVDEVLAARGPIDDAVQLLDI